MSEPRWHALLIGIDAYRVARPLTGCVNDIDAVQRVLVDRLGVPVDRIRRYAATLDDGVARPTCVTTRAPLREELRGALAAIAGDVAPGDRVFVYYAGHGAHRFVAADGTRYFREALVPHDDVVFDPAAGDDREQLIFDAELNAWLAGIASVTSAVTVILDCCHAAGTTRSIAPGVVAASRARFAPPPPGARPDTAPSGPRGMAALGRTAGMAAGRSASRVAAAGASVGDCMVVAACLDDEVAREGALTGETPHGELTRALLARLDTITDAALPALSWAQIWHELVDEVRRRNPYQTPWLSSHIGRAVFCGPPTDGDVGYRVRRVGPHYELNAGALCGVTPGARIAIYPSIAALRDFPPIRSPGDLGARLGELDVIEATGATAVAEAVDGKAPPDPLDADVRGRLVAAAPGERLRVSLAPHDDALAARIRSSLLEVVPDGEPGEIQLLACANGDREITDDVFGPDPAGDHHVLYRIPAAALAVSPTWLDPVRETVEHYVDYAAPLRLARRCLDLPHVLQLRLLDCKGQPPQIAAHLAEGVALPELPPDAPASYRLRARVDGPRMNSDHDAFTVELENISEHDLYATVLICQNSGRVTMYARRVLVAAHARTRAWLGSTKGLTAVATVPAPGERRLDRLVAIATTSGAATLDHLATDRTFAPMRNRSGTTRAVAGPPALWTSAVAIIRSS